MAGLVPDLPGTKGVQHRQKGKTEGTYLGCVYIVNCFKWKPPVVIRMYVCCIPHNAADVHSCVLILKLPIAFGYHGN